MRRAWRRPRRRAARLPSRVRQRVRALAMRCSASSWRTVPTRHGTHCPHDSSRKNAAMRRIRSRTSTVSSTTMTTPEPSVVPGGARVFVGQLQVELVRPHERARGAAEQHGCASSCRRSSPPAMSITARSVCRTGLRRRRAAGRGRDRQKSRVPVDCAVPTARERGAAFEDDARDVGQRLDVVDDGRLAEEPGVARGTAACCAARRACPSIDSKSAVSSPQM